MYQLVIRVVQGLGDRAGGWKRGGVGGRGREQQSVGTSATGHGLHVSSRETGSEGHSTEKASKMAPSAESVVGIASAACTRVSTRPATVLGQNVTMGRVQGYVIPYQR